MNIPPKDISAGLAHSTVTPPHQWSGHMADDVASTSGPEPLATLTATPAALLLASTRGNFTLPRAAITKLGRGDLYPWFFFAVRIHHNVPGCPRRLQFHPMGISSAELRRQLKALGYPAT